MVLMSQQETTYFFFRLSSFTMKGLSVFCNTKEVISPGATFLESDSLRHGTHIGCKMQQYQLEWQALWLFGSPIKNQVLPLTGICDLSKWSGALALTANLICLSYQWRNRQKQGQSKETSSTGIVKSYCSIITVTKATNTLYWRWQPH